MQGLNPSTSNLVQRLAMCMAPVILLHLAGCAGLQFGDNSTYKSRYEYTLCSAHLFLRAMLVAVLLIWKVIRVELHFAT